MSKVATRCPECQVNLKVRPDAIGRKVRCPKCEAIVRLDAAKEDEASPASTAQPGPALDNADPLPGDSQPARAAGLPMAKPVPMAKLINPTAPVPAPAISLDSVSPNPSGTGGNQSPRNAEVGGGAAGAAAAWESPGGLAEMESHGGVGQRPRVKFKRKRTNPWPTILLAVAAFAILGIVTLVIVIVQQNSPGTTTGGRPEIRFVNRSSVTVGQTVSIPIEVNYPGGWTPQQQSLWTVELAANQPPGVTFDAAASQVRWQPSPEAAGRTHLISVIVRDKQTGENNSTQFEVSVEASPAASETKAEPEDTSKAAAESKNDAADAPTADGPTAGDMAPEADAPLPDSNLNSGNDGGPK